MVPSGTTSDDNGALSGFGTVRGPLRDRPCRPAQPKSCPRASSRPSGVFGRPDSGSPSSRSAIPRDDRRARWAAARSPPLPAQSRNFRPGKPRRGLGSERGGGSTVEFWPAEPSPPSKLAGFGPSGGKRCAIFRCHNFPKASPRSRPFRPQTSGDRRGQPPRLEFFRFFLGNHHVMQELRVLLASSWCWRGLCSCNWPNIIFQVG